MNAVDRDLDRILMLLRNKIREHGYTQLQVQEQLEWGRSYISQLLTKQKSLRVEQVLLILDVIGVEPAAFYGELYRFPHGDSTVAKGEDYGVAPGQPPFNNSRMSENADGTSYQALDLLRSEVQRSRSMVERLLKVLEERQVLAPDEVESVRRELPLQLNENLPH